MSAHVTAAGREASVPVTTYVVYDTTAKTIDAIGSFRFGPNKFYAVTNSNGYLVQQGIAGRLGNYTVLARTTTSNDAPDTIVSTYFAKGRESNLELGNGNTASFPRSLKAVTRSLILSSGNLGIYESSSTLVFIATETKAANSSGETAAMVIERIRQRLEAQGYTPAP